MEEPKQTAEEDPVRVVPVDLPSSLCVARGVHGEESSLSRRILLEQ